MSVLSSITHFLNEGEFLWEEAATYPDMLKQIGVPQFFEWHFSGTPVYEVPSNYTPYPRNVSYGIKESIKTLKYKPTLMKSGNNKLQKSIFMRFLFHFIGDIHQPLHTSTNYQFIPSGD